MTQYSTVSIPVTNDKSTKSIGEINLVEKVDINSYSSESIESKLSEIDSKISAPPKNNSEYLLGAANNDSKQQEKNIEQQTRALYSALIHYTNDSVETIYVEQVMIKIAKDYSFRILGDVVQRISFMHHDLPDIIVALCDSLKRFEYEEVYPWGQTTVLSLLNHKDEAVIESLIILIDNWADKEFLPSLRSTNVSSKWLSTYIETVIQFLESCD